MTTLPTPFQLSEDQQAASDKILAAMKAGERVLVLRGSAGTGKTTMLKELSWRIRREMNLDISYVAPTGKAAARLKEKVFASVRTIHQALYGPPEETVEETEMDATGGEKTVEKLIFGDPHQPCDENTALICDEGSMVSKKVYRDLVAHLPENSFLLFVGDHEQLPPVKGTEGLSDLEAFSVIDHPWGPRFLEPTAVLTQVHRQALQSPVLQYALHILAEGEPLDKQFHNLSNAHGSITIQTWADHSAPSKWLASRRKAGVDATLISYTNKLRQEENAKVRKLRSLSILGDFAGRMRVGDQVVACANNHNNGVMNGEVFTVESLGTLGQRSRSLGPEYQDMILAGANGRRVAVDVVVRLVGQPRFEYEKLMRRRTYGQENYVHLDFGECLTAHKCVHPDTLVESEEGLLPIRDISDKGLIATPGGGREYRNHTGLLEESAGFRIETEGGYSLLVTADHGLDVWDEEKAEYVRRRADEIAPQDWLRLKLGVTVEPREPVTLPTAPEADVRAVRRSLPTEMTLELAEFLGMMVADGTIFRKGFRLVKRHEDAVDRFAELTHLLFPDVRVSRKPFNKKYPCAEVHSAFVVSWLHSLGGLSPCDKAVPRCVLRSTSRHHAAFLKGLFMDGSVHLKGGVLDHIELTQAHEGLIQAIRVMLLRLGIVVGKVRSKHRAHDNIAIYGEFASLYAKEIGFVSSFKQDRATTSPSRKGLTRYRVPIGKEEATALCRSGELTVFQKQNARANGYVSRATAMVAPSLQRRLDFHHERLLSITPVTMPSMCVEVPEGHRFLQNGISGWNCQGSQWDEVGIIWNRSVWGMGYHDPDSFRRWMYTAVTRSAKAVNIWVLKKEK